MSSPRVLVLLALVAFALTCLLRLPARWLPALLPQGVVCADPVGTAWSGSCSNFEARGVRAGAVRWSLRPLRLFGGRLAARLRLAQPDTTLEGEFAWSVFGGRLEGDGIRGDLALRQGGLLPGVPADLDGRVTLAVERFALRGRAVAALQGSITVRDLQQRSNEGLLPLGSYELRFADPPDAAGNINGRLKDIGGPLAVEGVLGLTAAPGYLLNGTVALRPSASASLARQIQFLGSPDANGRRPFSREETF